MAIEDQIVVSSSRVTCLRHNYSVVVNVILSVNPICSPCYRFFYYSTYFKYFHISTSISKLDPLNCSLPIITTYLAFGTIIINYVKSVCIIFVIHFS